MNKTPLRKCLVTHERLNKEELIRVVKTKDGEVFVDESGKANGRGAYMKLNEQVIKKAKKRKVLNRVFDTEVDDEIYERLLEIAKSS